MGGTFDERSRCGTLRSRDESIFTKDAVALATDEWCNVLTNRNLPMVGRGLVDPPDGAQHPRHSDRVRCPRLRLLGHLVAEAAHRQADTGQCVTATITFFVFGLK